MSEDNRNNLNGVDEIGKYLEELLCRAEAEPVKNGILRIENGVLKKCYASFHDIVGHMYTEGVGDTLNEKCRSYRNKLDKAVDIPEYVSAIGDDAFSLCLYIESITIPSTVKSIGDRAFQTCKSLESIIIPEGVESIGERAFSVCKSLTSAVLPSSLISIGDGAFAGCTNLASITIPEKFKHDIERIIPEISDGLIIKYV